MKNTKIEWTDETWNPISGCSKISAGCDNCYAARIAERFRGTKAYPDGFEVTIKPSELFGKRWRQPKSVFVCSMGDLFHEKVPYDVIGKIYETMLDNQHCTFYVLTKRPGKLLRALEKGYVSQTGFIWHGVSVENQQTADTRLNVLTKMRYSPLFVSIEPMLGPVDLTPWISKLNWVILGGETGPGARAVREEWIADVKNLCVENNVPFFFKKWGSAAKRKDRLFEGKEWNEIPRKEDRP
ncbi:MAG TPA: DUF5131 family protein [Mesotoga sp.]|nr:DUF5131 family protein [Mesotoga sp.]